MRTCRNPWVTCEACGRAMTSNLIGRHVRTHDPAVQEENRERKNARQRSYNQTPEGRETGYRRRRSPRGKAGAIRRNERWRVSPEGYVARLAHAAVYQAVKSGRLVKEPCRICGEARAFAHHPRGYEGVHRLDVEWLCLAHHMEAHGRTYVAA